MNAAAVYRSKTLIAKGGGGETDGDAAARGKDKTKMGKDRATTDSLEVRLSTVGSIFPGRELFRGTQSKSAVIPDLCSPIDRASLRHANFAITLLARVADCAGTHFCESV